MRPSSPTQGSGSTSETSDAVALTSDQGGKAEALAGRDLGRAEARIGEEGDQDKDIVDVGRREQRDREQDGGHGRRRPGRQSSPILSAAMKALCGISTWPNWRIRFLPSFCFSSSLRLRVMSPP